MIGIRAGWVQRRRPARAPSGEQGKFGSGANVAVEDRAPAELGLAPVPRRGILAQAVEHQTARARQDAETTVGQVPPHRTNGPQERDMSIDVMGNPLPGLGSELRVSPKSVLVACVILTQLLATGADILSFPREVVYRMAQLFLLTCALSAAGWLSANWKPLAGRWLTVLTLVVIVHLASAWLALPELLTLVFVPTALAAALISLPAATVVAGAESLVLVALWNYPGVGLSSSAFAVGLIASWAVLGVLCAVYSSVVQLLGWVEEYFGRAQHILEEQRDRQVELKQALEGLANANRQLALAGERMALLRAIAEQSERTKTAFVASVSHELRTPLNMIIGLVELMVSNPEIYAVVPSPKMRKDLETVHRNCEHLSDMINDVLDLTRLQGGRLALHRERVDLKEIIDSSVVAVRPLLEKKQLDLQVAIPDDLPQIYCDHTRIEQVILNLLSNAARCTEKGEIAVRVVPHDAHVLVSVRDTGPGISTEDAQRVFEPFWQGSGRLGHSKGGSGLGLSISRRFVELHGGRMWLESMLGFGAAFFFTVPTFPPVEHTIRPGHLIREDWVWREPAVKAGRLSHPDELAKPRLVIYDETGALYPRFMRYSDEVEFIETRDLAQTIGELQAYPPRAVVVNTMTSANPWQMVEAVKQHAPGTPIVGCSVPRQTNRAMEAGALGYLIKPVTRDDLRRAMEAVGKPVKRVLVVDDDLEVLDLFSRTLQVLDSTLEVVTTCSGAKALDEIRHRPPDLVLLDIVMPDMTGWQMLREMAQDEPIGRAPVFFVSAQDPSDQPLVADFVLATIDGGLPLSKLFRGALELSSLLLEPEDVPDLAPRRTRGAAQA